MAPEHGRGGANRCKKLHDVAKRASNKPVGELKVYPGARQSFDKPMQGPYHAEGDPWRVTCGGVDTLGRGNG